MNLKQHAKAINDLIPFRATVNEATDIMMDYLIDNGLSQDDFDIGHKWVISEAKDKTPRRGHSR